MRKWIWMYLDVSEYGREKNILPPLQTEEDLEQEFEKTKEVLEESQ